MIKVLVAALIGTVIGIAVMVVTIVAAGGETKNSSSIGLSLALSTAAVSSPASTPTSTPTSTPPPSSGGGSTGGSGGGNAAAGKAVFASNGCGSCHALAVAGASGTIGPDLGKLSADATKAGMPLPAFIQQSITDPAAFTASGGPWATAMPTTFGSSLSASQIADLVALIASGQQ
jgi:cytochrome c551/c552